MLQVVFEHLNIRAGEGWMRPLFLADEICSHAGSQHRRGEWRKFWASSLQSRLCKIKMHYGSFFLSFFLFWFVLFCFVLHVAFHRTCICLIRHWSSVVWSLRSRCRYLALTPIPSSCFSRSSLFWRWAQSREEQDSSHCTSTVTDFNHYCSHEMATKYLQLVEDQLCFCKVYFEQVAVSFFQLFRRPDWHEHI